MVLEKRTEPQSECLMLIREYLKPLAQGYFFMYSSEMGFSKQKSPSGLQRWFTGFNAQLQLPTWRGVDRSLMPEAHLRT